MLNRRHRLLAADDFRLVFRRGKKIPINGGLIVVLLTSQGNPLRCGFVVSKAVGNAVVRNAVKRRLRAACLPLVRGYSDADVVVRADKNAKSVSVEAWHQALKEALDRVGGS